MAGNDQHSSRDHDIQLPDLERPDGRHEATDVNAWAVGKFGFALAIVIGIAFLLLAGLFKYFQSIQGTGERASAGIGVDARKLPPEPRLQQTPALDLKAMRAAEDQLLTSYGWVDRQKGVVRIPIDRAIGLLAQRGLPSRPEGDIEAQPPSVSVPTESSLGPKMQQPGGPLAQTIAEGPAGEGPRK
jgi:hypothetical protein